MSDEVGNETLKQLREIEGCVLIETKTTAMCEHCEAEDFFDDWSSMGAATALMSKGWRVVEGQLCCPDCAGDHQ